MTLKKETVSQLKELYDKDKKRPLNQSFSAYVENILLQEIEYHKKLEEYGNFLEYIDAHDNEIFLKDNKKGIPVTVYINGKDKKLVCELDKSDCCIHVGFCYAVKKVYDILLEHGFKPPKKID